MQQNLWQNFRNLRNKCKGSIYIAYKLNLFTLRFRDGIVTTHELFEAIQALRNAPDEAKTKRLLEVLDQDSDGEMNLEELRMV